MDSSFLYLLAADAILYLHVLIAMFIIIGLILIFAGKAFSWGWIYNPWFRLIHLLTISIVVIQSWFGIICPFTTLEMELRSKAGDAVYSGTFISHWLETILYYQAPAWVFIVCYTVFGIIVFASWFLIRPRPF
ncbi:MAG: DUF2784 domain-containing protein [Gammaproteobacteria bacterium]|nr:DUF2784 domain-containing protein [Gammaproteobacteria bacterium]